MTLEEIYNAAYKGSYEGVKDAHSDLYGDTYLNKTEACNFLKISRPTLDRYIKRGLVRVHENGKLKTEELMGFNVMDVKNKKG